MKLALDRRGRTQVKQRARQGRKLKFVLNVKVSDAAGTGVSAKRTISVRP